MAADAEETPAARRPVLTESVQDRGRTSMTKLKMLAATAIATATLGVGTLAAAAPASAYPMTCGQARWLALTWINVGNERLAVGDYAGASYWFGRASGVMDASNC
jgi:hypothetical protein